MSVTFELGEGEAQKDVKSRRFQVQFDLDYKGTFFEAQGESETHPDLSITVRQLLEQYSIGPDGRKVEVRQPLYFDTHIPMMRDITDVYEFKRHVEERLAAVNQWIKDNPPPAQEEPDDLGNPPPAPGDQLEIQ